MRFFVLSMTVISFLPSSAVAEFLCPLEGIEGYYAQAYRAWETISYGKPLLRSRRSDEPIVIYVEYLGSSGKHGAYYYHSNVATGKGERSFWKLITSDTNIESVLRTLFEKDPLIRVSSKNNVEIVLHPNAIRLVRDLEDYRVVVFKSGISEAAWNDRSYSDPIFAFIDKPAVSGYLKQRAKAKEDKEPEGGGGCVNNDGSPKLRPDGKGYLCED